MFKDIFKILQKKEPAAGQNDVEVKPEVKRFKFEANQRIELTASNKGQSVMYPSSIQDVFEDIIAVSAPIQKGNYVFFQDEEALQVTVLESTGIYSFTTKIAGKVSGPVALLYLHKPTQIKRYQQREYVRAKAFLPVRYSVDKEHRISHLPQKEYGHCQMRDISVGGICLAFPENLPAGETVRIQFEFEPPPQRVKRPLQADVEILRSKKDAFSDKYFTSAIFKDIAESDREQISRFVASHENV